MSWRSSGGAAASNPFAGVSSPLTFMETISALGVGVGDTFYAVAGGGGYAGGSSFEVVDVVGVRKCTGGNFRWNAGATTVKVSLWQWTGVGAAVRVASGTVVVGAGSARYNVTFGAPVTLVPGYVYTITAWDTAGVTCTNFANTTANSVSHLALGGGPIPGAMFGQPWVVYTLPPGNGGGSCGPFASYGSGDVQPGNVSSSGYSCCEPVFG